MLKLRIQSIKEWIQKIDWKLLVFLLLFLDVKLIVKVAAIILIYILRWNFKFGIKAKQSRLPLFYVLVIVIATINFAFLASNVPFNYLIVFVSGVCLWGISLLTVHQVKLAVEHNSTIVLHNTLLVFFIINIIASLVNLAGIIAEIHTVNPYRYQGQFQKYFINTGDYIKGITFDTSTTNAIINALGVVYFLYKKHVTMTLACMAVLLLTASNFTNIILLIALIILFFFKSAPDQRSTILLCFMLLVIFLKVSPQNDQYVLESFKNFLSPIHPSKISNNTLLLSQRKADKELTSDEERKKIALLYLDSLDRVNQQKTRSHAGENLALLGATGEKLIIPEPSIHTPPFQSKKDTTPFQEQLLNFISFHKPDLRLSTSVKDPKLPGKAVAATEAWEFIQRNPRTMLAGAGMGNFSSKLAFKATALNIAGSYPENYRYISHDFLRNHLDIYLYYFTRHTGAHSLTNTPNSVYLQLLTEYGLFGLFAFLTGYLLFFLKEYKRLTYGVPLLFIMLSAFAIEYWFEQLSIVVLWELMVFLNIKESQGTAYE